jgi:uncharacterized protein (TIGR00730 family)
MMPGHRGRASSFTLPTAWGPPRYDCFLRFDRKLELKRMDQDQPTSTADALPTTVAAHPPVITVFGSSRITPESPEYGQARRLGKLLAEAGYHVCNGGYSGAMEGVSRGAREGGGRAIGVTVQVLGGLAPNEFIDEVVGTSSLLMRLDQLTALASGYVILQGGIGTLLEMALVWNLHLMKVYHDKPIVLLGPEWRRTVECFSQQILIRDVDLAALIFVDTPEEALAALQRSMPASSTPSDWRG